MLSYDPPSLVKGQDSTPTTALTSTVKANAASLQSVATQARSASPMSDQKLGHTHIWLVTGPAGCGKTTVAQYIADSLSMPFIEGDSFHSAANVEKMRSGTPLTDADRWDWLTALREESMRKINEGWAGVVLTCSALKRKYRDVIRVAAYYDHHLLIHFIYLDAPEEVLLQRVMRREGHYMGANMVHSQFDILERPSNDERDVTTIDVSRSLEEVQRDALNSVIDMMESDDANQ